MTRAALIALLVACTANSNDYPLRPGGGGGGVIIGGGGTGGTTGDGGVGDGGDGDAGVSVSGRVCILKDLRQPTLCDTNQDASKVSVSIGGRSPASPPAKTGEFTILAPLGTDLVWHATGVNFIRSAMPFGTDNLIPIVPQALYSDLLLQNMVTLLAEGQGSVVVRTVTGAAPAPGVSATTTLVTANVIPLYDADTSPTDWRELGPTQTHGVLWFPGVNDTTTPARVTLTRIGGTPVVMSVNVEEQTITFLTQDVP
jgi:hypothetical protein